MERYQVIRRPLITEKGTIAREQMNQYAFEVDVLANKVEISQAVEGLFKVKVIRVRVINMLGKKKRMGRIVGKKKSWKKAIVTLAAGNRIEVIEGV